ncbi:MAG: hypothetical protein KC431_16265 [Myxococcales bacterium]|nr:hypothetical protein [Myxococcales bacterium]MCA9699078.1 hypothetical protein [Myxococcales bacterium]
MSAEDHTRLFWEEVEAIFDPEKAADDPRLFCARDPDYNPLVRLQRELARPTGRISRKHLLVGTVGNGKTSELYHLAGELAPTRMVVLLDLWQHFVGSVRDPNAIDRIEPWELLGLLGLAIYRAGIERFDHSWDDEPKKLQKALETLRKQDTVAGGDAEIDVSKLARGLAIAASGVIGAALAGPVGAALGTATASTVGTAGLAVLDAASDATSWSWPVGLPGTRKRSDQDTEVRSLLAAVNEMIRSLQGAYARRLLLIVDGLDRVRDGERARTLFAESSLTLELDCDLLATSPFELLGEYAHEGRGPQVQILCNVPVLSRADPSQPGPGLVFFHELTSRRLAEVGRILREKGVSAPDDPLPPAIVDRLARYGGGLPREFVRMVRMVAGEAWEAQITTIDDTIVDRVLREARRLKEAQLTAEEIELLEAVMADPQHRRPGGALANKLIEQLRLLPYPNDTEWYYPHPLLTLALLKPQPTATPSPS